MGNPQFTHLGNCLEDHNGTFWPEKLSLSIYLFIFFNRISTDIAMPASKLISGSPGCLRVRPNC